MKTRIIPALVYISYIAIFTLMLSSPGFAAHPLITDDTGTQGKGKFQLEVNGEYGHDKDEGVITKTLQAASTLTYGISDPLDIIFGIPYQHIKTEAPGSVMKSDGISDLSLEMKWKFYTNEGLSFALKPGLTLPTGDQEKGLGAGKTTGHLFFIGTQEIQPWAFHLNLGYIRNENKSQVRKNLWHASFASTVEVAKNLRIVGNIGIQTDADQSINGNPAFILGGLIYSISENFDIDFGIKGGLTKAEKDYSVLAGITYRF